MEAKKMRIVFMGTPEFAVPSLRALVEAGYRVVAVVTAPDKPAGRGRKLHESRSQPANLDFPFCNPRNSKRPNSSMPCGPCNPIWGS